jgi:NADH-quinone oxidoreductase subunit E
MDAERIDQIIDEHQAAPDLLIQILLAIQSEYNWLPPAALQRVGQKLRVPMARILHIATFYKAFSLIPKGRHKVHVCTGTACHVRGAQRVLDTVQDLTGIGAGETDLALKFSLETVNCIGCCALGPVIDIDGEIHGNVSTRDTARILEQYS